jgi:hypothetical protein
MLGSSKTGPIPTIANAALLYALRKITIEVYVLNP